MKGIIDRFEEDKAVLEMEDGKMLVVEISALPKGVKEGDLVRWTEDGPQLDRHTSEKRTNEIEKLMDELFE